jgi:pre-rRNA-processing protein TSR4
LTVYEKDVQLNQYFQTWLDGKTAPSGAYAKCRVCNEYTSLLLQLNGDMPDKFPGHERWLYIFGCRRKACRRKDGCIRGFRGTRQSRNKAPHQQNQAQELQNRTTKAPIDIGGALFRTPGSTNSSSILTNPFSTNNNPFSSSSTSPNPFASASALAAKPPQKVEVDQITQSFAEKARIGAVTGTQPNPRPFEPWPEESKLPPPYPHFHLDAEYETLSAPSTPQTSHSVPTIPANGAEGDEGGGGSSDKDLFESTMDKTFQRFADRVAQNPEQVLRYEFNGTPLLYSTSDAVGKLLGADARNKLAGKVSTVASDKLRIPTCTNCGAARVFEAQLMPHAITELEEDEMSIDGMDWGTIILGVCSKDCSAPEIAQREVRYVEEWIGVQWEEIDEKKK